MKYLFIPFLFFFPLTITAQQMIGSEHAELGSVPEWVKETVTPEEYKLWETLSNYFRVDYSVLRVKQSPEHKKRLYNKVKEICNDLEAGNWHGMKRGDNISFIAPIEIDTTLQWKTCIQIQLDDDLVYCKRKAVVKQIAEDKSLECIMGYIHNTKTNEVTVLTEEFLPVGVGMFYGIDGAVHQPEYNRIQVSCAGHFTCFVEGKAHDIPIELSFALPLR